MVGLLRVKQFWSDLWVGLIFGLGSGAGADLAMEAFSYQSAKKSGNRHRNKGYSMASQAYM
jgi:hypothetical protein